MARLGQKEPRRIPEFASRQEMAEWFDSHDTTDYEDEFTPVNIRFAKKLSEPLTIRLDLETLARLRARAKKKGMPPATLVTLWVLERLHADPAE